MDCPGCSQPISDWKKSHSCGWKQGSTGYGEQVPAHLTDARCSFTTDGRRCDLVGTVSSGGGDAAKYYCLWHYGILSDVSRNTPVIFAEWRDYIAPAYPDSVWSLDPGLLWDRMNGRRTWKEKGPRTVNNTEDPVLSKRCSQLVNDILSRRITRENYIEELRKLDKEYPGIGFDASVSDLAAHWGLEGYKTPVGAKSQC